MEREVFEQLVVKAIEALPEEFISILDNIDVSVEDYPSPDQLAEEGLESEEELLGLYEGIPLTRRSSGYGMVLPDKITIFQKPIEAICHDETGIVTEIQKVVKHEVAHHFGIDETRLNQIEESDDRNS